MRRAFTLIELLVVIAIIAILAAILFPVFAQAREAAKTTADVSNTRQVGLAVVMYRGDYDGAMPIFYAYNTQTPSGQPAPPFSANHKGVEVALFPYLKNKDVFKSPFDSGGPWQVVDVPGTSSYWQAYGSSYRFTTCMYTVVPGESSQNNDRSSFTTLKVVNDSGIEYPSETRVIRLEMMPFFSRSIERLACDKYGYDCDPPYNYFRFWSKRGGPVALFDGSARNLVSAGSFDATRVNPEGRKSGEALSTSWSGTWYGSCD